MSAPDVVQVVAERLVEGAITAEAAVQVLATVAEVPKFRAALQIADRQQAMFDGRASWAPREYRRWSR